MATLAYVQPQLQRRRRCAGAALAATVLALSAAPAALADLAPATGPPKLSKHTCARHGVVTTPAGPAARCLARTIDTLRAPRHHSGASGSAHAAHHASSPASTGRSGEHGGAKPGPAARATPHANSDGTAGYPRHSNAGASIGAALFIVVIAGAITAALLLALGRGAIARRRTRGRHAATS
jgi:hypothetical protein